MLTDAHVLCVCVSEFPSKQKLLFLERFRSTLMPWYPLYACAGQEGFVMRNGLADGEHCNREACSCMEEWRHTTQKFSFLKFVQGMFYVEKTMRILEGKTLPKNHETK